MDEDELKARLTRLMEEHRDLDVSIGALLRLQAVDSLQIQRLKRRKLQLRDEIAVITDQLIPDIIA